MIKDPKENDEVAENDNVLPPLAPLTMAPASAGPPRRAAGFWVLGSGTHRWVYNIISANGNENGTQRNPRTLFEKNWVPGCRWRPIESVDCAERSSLARYFRSHKGDLCRQVLPPFQGWGFRASLLYSRGPKDFSRARGSGPRELQSLTGRAHTLCHFRDFVISWDF